jgi:hypothetical protein
VSPDTSSPRNAAEPVAVVKNLENCESETIEESDLTGAQKRIRVLFIGNSLTYTNNIPCRLKRIGDSSSNFRFEIGSLTVGGAKIDSFLKGGLNSPAYQKIHSKKWDYVVLQQQSISMGLYLDRLYTVDVALADETSQNLSQLKQIEYSSHESYSNAWCSYIDSSGGQPNINSILCTYDRIIRDAGAIPVIYMHWTVNGNDWLNSSVTPPDASSVRTMEQRGSFLVAAQMMNAIFAPVAVAMENAYASSSFGWSCPGPKCLIEYSDGEGPFYHPQIPGAYLAASVFFASLTGTSPEKLSSLDLDSDTALQLQRIAWNSYSDFNSNGLILQLKACSSNAPEGAAICPGFETIGLKEINYGGSAASRCVSVEKLNKLLDELEKHESNPYAAYLGSDEADKQHSCYRVIGQ